MGQFLQWLSVQPRYARLYRSLPQPLPPSNHLYRWLRYADERCPAQRSDLKRAHREFRRWKHEGIQLFGEDIRKEGDQ